MISTIQLVLAVAIGCAVIYITAKLIFMAYFAARSEYIKQVLKIAKEIKSNG